MRLRAALLAAATALLLPTVSGAQSFTEVLESAYRTNPRLQAERARLREIDESFVQARAQGRLSANANVQYTPTVVRTPNTGFFGEPGEGTNTDFVSQRQAGLQVIQPIYQGGRVKFLKRQAKANILSARESLRQSEQATLLEAANAYLDVIRDEQASEIRRSNVRVLLRQQDAATVRFDVGEGTRTDIAQSDARLAQARIGLAQADAQLQSSRAAFARAVGYPPQQLEALPPIAIPATLEEAIDIGLNSNPQLMASYFNQQAADAGVDVAKAAGRPTLSLNGQVGILREQLNALSRAENAALSAQLTVPIFSGGLNRSRVRQAKHARTRAGFESRDLERAVVQTVSTIWAQLQAAREVVRASIDQVAAAEIAFEGVELEQQVGTRTALDVLDAEQELLNARLNVVDAERQRDLAVFQLLSTLGGFTADGLQLSVDPYDPRDHFEAATYEGMDQIVDTYVPEAVAKIGRQVPDAVEAIAGGVVDGLDAIEVLDVGEKLIEQSDDLLGAAALGVKGAVDTVTFQNRDVPATPGAPDAGGRGTGELDDAEVIVLDPDLLDYEGAE